jgi:large subunit ribosomal protein L30e
MSRKTKKTTKNISSQLPLAIRTGKYCVGFKTTLDSLVNQQCKYLIITKNYPTLKRMQLEYYAVLGGKVPIYMFDGTNKDLANICGSEFRMGVISIIDDGEAELIPSE